MKHRPWWKPGNTEGGSWRPNEPKSAPPTPPEAHVAVVPAPPSLDEVVLVRQGNTVQAVYRRFVRE